MHGSVFQLSTRLNLAGSRRRERESRTALSGVDDVMAGPDGLLFFMAFLSEAFFFKIIIN